MMDAVGEATLFQVELERLSSEFEKEVLLEGV